MGKLVHSAPALDLVDSAPALPLHRQASDRLQQLLAAVSLAETILPQGSAQQQLPPLVLGAAHRVASSVPNQLQQEAYLVAQQTQRHLQPAAVFSDQTILPQRQEEDLGDLATAAQRAEVSLDPHLQSRQLDSVGLELQPQQQQALVSVALDLAPQQPQRRVVDFSEEQVLLVLDLELLQHSQLPRASVLAKLINKLNSQPRQADYLAVVGLLDRTISKSLAACSALQRHQQQGLVGFSDSQHKHSNLQAVAYLEVPSNLPQVDCSERSLQLVVSLGLRLAQGVAFSAGTKQHSQRKPLEAFSEIPSNRRVVCLAASLPQA